MLGELQQSMQFWLMVAVAVGSGLIGGLIARHVLMLAVGQFTKRTKITLDDALLATWRGPSMIIFPAFGIQLALTAVPDEAAIQGFIRHLITISFIVGVAWLVMAILNQGGRLLLLRKRSDDQPVFTHRALETRIHLLTRIANTIVAVIAGAIVLMTFPGVKELGASILASAGIAGVVAGLAAQSLLANVLSGIQLALTEPIRLGDAVVIEGEFGTVEEIGASFVIVRTWDLRRLIIPLSFFMENRFENWTLTSSDLLGSAMLHVDYSAPIDALRNELNRILNESSDWDRKVAVLQVTDATDRTIQVRALMSAGNPATLWNLRCEVREKLIQFLQQNHVQTLPRLRAEIVKSPGAPEAAPLLT